jgi:2-polyprenyl-3-methyl-5-hydroxy-6-metoxy-1,4-benzoquinol methylase
MTVPTLPLSELAAFGLHERILGIVSSLPKGRALDLGAGDGAFAQRLHALGYDAVACDIDAGLYKASEIPFRAGNINDGIPFDDASIDLVVFIEVLEHLKNPWKAIEEMHRVLRPGGYLVLSTPNVGNLRQRLHSLLHGHFYGFGHPVIRSPLEHIHPFSLAELVMMMNENGFEDTTFLFDRPFRLKRYLPTNRFTGLTTIVKARRKS